MFNPIEKNVQVYLRYSQTEWKSFIFRYPSLFDDIFKFTKDNFYSYQMGVSFEKNFTHFPLFRDEFTKLFESGILKKYGLSTYNEKTKKYYEIITQEIETKVLTVEDLHAGFVVWLVTVILAIIVFFCEILFFKFQTR